jgi:hypothetical protein
MDLGTVKQKLDDGEYESVEAWADDIRLVWSNATTFNCEGNDVHEFAKGLAISFEKMLKQFPKIAGAPGGPAAAAGGGGASLQGGGGRQVLELKRTMEKLQQELASLKGKPAPAATTPAKKKAPGTGGGGRKAMNFEEKRNLSLNINKLDNDKLIKVAACRAWRAAREACLAVPCGAKLGRDSSALEGTPRHKWAVPLVRHAWATWAMSLAAQRLTTRCPFPAHNVPLERHTWARTVIADHQLRAKHRDADAHLWCGHTWAGVSRHTAAMKGLGLGQACNATHVCAKRSMLRHGLARVHVLAASWVVAGLAAAGRKSKAALL